MVFLQGLLLLGCQTGVGSQGELSRQDSCGLASRAASAPRLLLPDCYPLFSLCPPFSRSLQAKNHECNPSEFIEIVSGHSHLPK